MEDSQKPLNFGSPSADDPRGITHRIDGLAKWDLEACLPEAQAFFEPYGIKISNGDFCQNAYKEDDGTKLGVLLRELVLNHDQYPYENANKNRYPGSITFTVHPDHPRWVTVTSQGYITPTQFEELQKKVEFIQSHPRLARLDLSSKRIDALPSTTSRGCGYGSVYMAQLAHAKPYLEKLGDCVPGEEVFPFRITYPFKTQERLRFEAVQGPNTSKLAAKNRVRSGPSPF